VVKLLSLVFVLPKSEIAIFCKKTIKNIYISTTENLIDKTLSVPTPPPLYS